MTPKSIRIGARASNLSRTQAAEIARLLEAAHPGIQVEIVPFVTTGDVQLETPLPLMGGKGVFTSEIESALIKGEIDLAVHSLKDLPVEMPAGIAIGAIPERADADDLLLTRNGERLDELENGATVGTSSHRRAAQIRLFRPDLKTDSIRGNVETRIRKLNDVNGPYEAIILARAGLDRLGIAYDAESILPAEIMLPAPGQAAIAVQCRDDHASITWTAAIDHAITHFAVLAERSFLAGLGGGCSAPVAALATVNESLLTIRGRVIAIDGSSVAEVNLTADCRSRAHAIGAGSRLAVIARANGASAILEASGK